MECHYNPSCGHVVFLVLVPQLLRLEPLGLKTSRFFWSVSQGESRLEPDWSKLCLLFYFDLWMSKLGDIQIHNVKHSVNVFASQLLTD